MKKLLLLSTAALASMVAVAQNKTARTLPLTSRLAAAASQNTANKGAGNGDSILRSNIFLGGSTPDTLTYYVYDFDAVDDTGFITGYNAFGHQAYAELYRINTAGTIDSTVSVIGMYTYLYGAAAPASTKNVVLTAWSAGTPTNPEPTRPNLFFSGKPDAIIGSSNVALTALADPTDGSINIDTIVFFQTPSTYTGGDFYAGVQFPGYDYNNLAGDTAILIATKDGNRRSNTYGYISGPDTTFLMQNLFQDASGNWTDFYQESDVSIRFHLFALPIIKINIPSNVNGVTKSDLTVFGTFPNPAANATTLKVSFEKATTAQIDLFDLNGRKVRSVHNGAIAAGTQELPINTSDLAAGNYVIMIRTASGEGMGLQMTVAK